jgi:protein-disulfide isomerase
MKNNKGYFLPVSIVIAAVLISGAIIWNAGKSSSPEENVNNVDTSSVNGPAELISPPSEEDHIRGVLGAPITIIEYTDFECPYCSDFHNTMERLVENYEGQITWIERQFPIEGLHPTAPKEAEASECVAKLGGNDAFWEFSDKVFETTPQNESIDLDKLPQIAEEIGIDKNAFTECLDNGDTAHLVEEDLAETELLNEWNYEQTGRYIGTPYSVAITEDGKSVAIPGALPYEQMEIFINQLLEQN